MESTALVNSSHPSSWYSCRYLIHHRMSKSVERTTWANYKRHTNWKVQESKNIKQNSTANTKNAKHKRSKPHGKPSIRHTNADMGSHGGWKSRMSSWGALYLCRHEWPLHGKTVLSKKSLAPLSWQRPMPPRRSATTYDIWVTVTVHAVHCHQHKLWQGPSHWTAKEKKR